MQKTYGTVLDREGNAVSGAEIYVRNDSGGALATLYSDNGVTGTANPTTSDTNGYWSFFVTDGLYTIQVYVDGVQQREITKVQIFDDQDNEIAAIRSMTSAANKGPYFTGSGTGSTYDLTASGRAVAGLTGAADKAPYYDGAGTAALADFKAPARSLGALADPNADRIPFWDDSAGAVDWLVPSTGLVIATTNLSVDVASTANYRANTADKILDTDGVWASADYVALTDAATVAVDMSLGFNFSVTLGGNRTLGAPSNTKNGQTGAIVITQDGTGSRTLAYHANYKFAGGTDPTLSTAAGAIDVLFYQVISSTSIIANLVKAIA